MTIWDARNGKADYLDARETAPMAATEDMFNGNARLAMYGKGCFLAFLAKEERERKKKEKKTRESSYRQRGKVIHGMNN